MKWQALPSLVEPPAPADGELLRPHAGGPRLRLEEALANAERHEVPVYEVGLHDVEVVERPTEQAAALGEYPVDGGPVAEISLRAADHRAARHQAEMIVKRGRVVEDDEAVREARERRELREVSGDPDRQISPGLVAGARHQQEQGRPRPRRASITRPFHATPRRAAPSGRGPGIRRPGRLPVALAPPPRTPASDRGPAPPCSRSA